MPSPQAAIQPSDTEWLARLCLARTTHVGPVTYHSLMRRFGSAAAALEALPHMAMRAGAKQKFVPCLEPDARREWDATKKMGGHMVFFGTPAYPTLLANIPDAPPVLSVLGQPALLLKKAVGLVGARNASLNGKKMAHVLATGLGQAGFVVASGLARGIDAAAHDASLGTGTVAAMAGGLDHLYPPEHEKLYARIAEAGAIISDMPLGTEPRAQLFPRRNRLIAGLSVGVVVVEAAAQSGSLITANYARDYGREVFAVPGSPLDPRCGGSNFLIKQGAQLVENVNDILDNLPKHGGLREPARTFDDEPMNVSDSDMTAAHAVIAENLGPSPVGIDELVQQCHLPAALVNAVLVELELAGRLQRLPGQMVCWVG